MNSKDLESGPAIDVAIIGGGPSGLAAATTLKDAGIARVVVLERESMAGGIPRHCGHPPFGMREFRRVLKGPEYAARLVAQAQQSGVEIHLQTTVVEVSPGGSLMLATPERLCQITARRVIYATGVRETPRAARLISGARVQGVMNTGALQSMIFLKQRRPFLRPVIIGSELVAFSALMTCSHAGIRPVAMIEAGRGAKARWPSALFPRLKGVDFLANTRLLEINGTTSVGSVTVVGPDERLRTIDCDGVVLTGQFTPEAALARCGHLMVDPATGGPLVDQWGRCSDPCYFATGNLLRPVETAGRSWAEGRLTGRWVARDLNDQLPKLTNLRRILIRDPRLKFAMPQLIGEVDTTSGMKEIQIRVNERISGTLVARTKEGLVWHRAMNTRPERRFAVPIGDIVSRTEPGTVELSIEAPRA